jgi:hypothetical protein
MGLGVAMVLAYVPFFVWIVHEANEQRKQRNHQR